MYIFFLSSNKFGRTLCAIMKGWELHHIFHCKQTWFPCVSQAVSVEKPFGLYSVDQLCRPSQEHRWREGMFLGRLLPAWFSCASKTYCPLPGIWPCQLLAITSHVSLALNSIKHFSQGNWFLRFLINAPEDLNKKKFLLQLCLLFIRLILQWRI